MEMSKIEMIKLVRLVTSPQLGLVNAKKLVEAGFCDGFSGYRIKNYSDLEPLLNLCFAYNHKVFTFTESYEIVWGRNPMVSQSELVEISKNPHRYVDGR